MRRFSVAVYSEVYTKTDCRVEKHFNKVSNHNFLHVRPKEYTQIHSFIHECIKNIYNIFKLKTLTQTMECTYYISFRFSNS